MDNRIIFGDCLEKLKLITAKSMDMVFGDLPQGITKNKWDVIIPFEPMWIELERIIKDNGVIILMGNQPFTSALLMSNKKLFRYSMVWEKSTPTGFLNAKRMPLRSHEDILIFYKKPPIYYPQKTTGHPRKVSSAHHKRNSVKTENYGSHGLVSYDSTERYPKSILKFKTDKQHSSKNATQKPVALMELFIKSFTKEGDNMVDFCMGSGTFLEAAKNTNRNCIGIEKNEIEFNKAAERLGLILSNPK